MRPNTNRSKAKGAMRASGNTKMRAEQKLAAQLIRNHLPLWCKVEMEEEVKLYDADHPDVPYERSIDIAVWNRRDKIAIEMNGPPHDEQLQVRKDNRRITILEWPGNDWDYTEFSYIKMPNLFARATRKITIEEALKAYDEIKIAIGPKLPLAAARKEMIETILRKTQLEDSDQVS